MKYTKLGNSDLNVSRICMGCMGGGRNQIYSTYPGGDRVRRYRAAAH